MIVFDNTKLSVEIVLLKAVSTALGGSISVIDPERTTDKKEAVKRIVVPMAVARSFIMRTKKVTRYLKPVLVALVRYDNHVVAMERHPLGTMGTLEYEDFGGTMRRWMPACERNVEDVIRPLVGQPGRKWYFDGRYVYALPTVDVDVAVRDGEFLTSDGRFRKILATTVDLMWLSDRDALEPSARSCLAFVTSRGTYSISPPIWKNLSNVGVTQLKRVGTNDEGEDEEDDDSSEGTPDAVTTRVYTFDQIDTTFAVNLNFSLKAGNEIGRTFGYEYIEPLGLLRLMTELHTVNLPNAPSQIKATYNTGLRFTHALAWLLGMSRNAQTLETYMMVRSLMKYLTKKGIFRNNVFDADRVFKGDKTVADVPRLKLDTLLNDTTSQVSLSTIIEHARMGIKARRKAGEDTHQFGGMLNEE